MKTILAVLTMLGAISLGAQTYSIDWFTIDGGGGTSTGGVYSVSGGNFSLDGGFWGIIAAVQTPGSPFLRVFLTTTNTVVVAWPAPSTGFNLQENSALGTTNWTAVSSGPATVGSEKQVIVSPPVGNRFYRLKY